MLPKIFITVSLILTLCTKTYSQSNSSNQAPILASDTLFRPYLAAIVTEDVEKLSKWYAEKLGFIIARKMNLPEYDSLYIVFLKLGKAELELIQKKNTFSIKKYKSDYNGFTGDLLQGFTKVSFWVSDATTLANYLKTTGIKFVVNLFDDKILAVRSFIIADPDGNILQFSQPLAQ